MNYLSVCSGIEAATVAWEPLGFKPLGFSEIEEFPCAVLQNHYPNVKNFGDMTQFQGWEIDGSIKILVGGTPCQSFSVAGLRKGLGDPRGNLCLTYIGIADKFKPRWIVWENVPGVLSSNGGRDFGSFLGALEKCGYGWSYRVLDAQWFGVAQRRRRVFVVGHLGSWQRAAAVLFERTSLRRDTAPSREKRQGVAATITRGFGDCGIDADQIINGNYSLANCLQTTCNDYSRADGFNLVLEDQGGSVINVRTDGTVGTLRRETHGHEPIIIHGTQDPIVSDIAFSQGRNNGGENVCIQRMAVRRLTPIECERLQGFPDNYTLISYRKKPAEQCPDSHRYKALDNSMAVPVMKWIGQRIAMVEAIK